MNKYFEEELNALRLEIAKIIYDERELSIAIVRNDNEIIWIKKIKSVTGT